MKANLQNVKNEVENILDYLVENKIAVYTNTRHEESLGGTRTRLTWQRGAATHSSLAKLRFGTWQEYREFVESGRYAFMLEDGSFFFLSYEFQDTKLLGHSLLFYPCPIDFEWDDSDEIPLLEMVEFGLSEKDAIQFRSPVRFDFDSVNQSLHHPEVHAHLNSGQCRLGVSHAMSPSMFFSTVFRLFYFEVWEKHKFIQKGKPFDLKPKLLTAQRDWAHLAFRN